jgi:hypothetical protein
MFPVPDRIYSQFHHEKPTLGILHNRPKPTMFAFKRSSVFSRYDYRPLPTALPPSTTECPICWRDFGSAEDDSLAPCHPLQTPCGHIVGSACVEEMIQRDVKMQCQTCFRDVPRVGMSLTKRLHDITQWPPFSYSKAWLQRYETFQHVDEMVVDENVDGLEAIVWFAYHFVATEFLYITVQVALNMSWCASEGEDCKGRIFHRTRSSGPDYWQWAGQLFLRSSSTLAFDAKLTVCLFLARAVIGMYPGMQLGKRVLDWLIMLPVVRIILVFGDIYVGTDLMLCCIAGMELVSLGLFGALALCSYWRI